MKFFCRLKNFLRIFFISLVLTTPVVAADEIGRVKNLTGAISAKSAEGTLRVLVQRDSFFVGDTLYTGNDSYARLRFTDGGEIILKPDTHFKLTGYHFVDQQPASDEAGFSLLKGGLRALTGLISKRGKKEGYAMKTPDATIGIRGTDYGLQVCRNDCDHMTTEDNKRPRNGLHLQVDMGAIYARNKAGSLDIVGGEFAYVADENTMPVEVSYEEALHLDIPERVLLQWRAASHECGAYVL